jgi:carbohydrate-binding DOMON domain-containing protein
MFDLTGFRVLSDERRLYFELTYRDLVERPDSTGWGFGGTFTRIAIDRGGPGEEAPFSFH